MRLPTLLLLLLICSLNLAGSSLDDRLALVYPATDRTDLNERKYLAGRIQNIVRQLRYTDRIGRKDPGRQMIAIKTRLRREVLLNYYTTATLGDAFRTGHYNDITATLLFALTLEEFGIAYSVHVDHWESFLTVDPAGRAAELHHPTARIAEPDEQLVYRREYLTLLRHTLDRELADLDDNAADSLYYRYHYRTEQTLDFRELAAYYHFRRAGEAYSRDHYRRTCRYLETANRLAPRPAFAILRRAATLQTAALSAATNDTYVDQLFGLWHEQPGNAYLAADLLHRFDGRQQKLLAAGALTEAVRLKENYLSRSPQHPEWRKQVELLQRLRLLDHYQERGEIVPALRLAEALLIDAPDDPRFQTYVAELTLTDLRYRYLDPAELVRQTADAATTYPFLKQTDRYADILLRESALEVRDLFAADDRQGGQRALAEFREKLKQIPRGHDRPLWTLTAFIAASNYYFALEEYPAALAYVEEALTHDPASDFLLHQQDLLRRY